jgi:hypothetical protein
MKLTPGSVVLVTRARATRWYSRSPRRVFAVVASMGIRHG